MPRPILDSMNKHTNRVREHCLAKPGAVEEEPWGHPVFKVGGRIFVGMGEAAISVKSTPDRQSVLIHDPAISVAKYSGRFGWVSIELADDTVHMAFSLIDDSYDAVFAGLPRKARDKIAQ